MRIPDSKLEEISEKLSIEQVVGEYVVLTYRNGRHWGLCPFHNEKTPSFSVSSEKGLFYCFGCHKGGTIFQFIMDMEHLSFVEAVEKLAEKAGVDIGAYQYDKASSKQKAVMELYTRVAGSFNYILNNSDEGTLAKQYIKQRGITEESVEVFQIGFSPSDRLWLHRFLRKKEYSPSFLAETGLFLKKKHELAFFHNRIMFPIRKSHGQVIGFGARSLGDREPKYLNSPESDFFQKRKHLYGLAVNIDNIRKQDQFILVEGYTDVITLYQAGLRTAVAPLGTSLTEEQARLLKRYANQAYILFDGDDAGLRAAEKAAYILEEQEFDINVVPLPEGADPADVYKKEGPDGLKKSLEYSINSFDFLLERALIGKNSEDTAVKRQVIERLHPYLKIIGSEVKRDGCIRRLAEKLQVSSQSIWHDYLLKEKAPQQQQQQLNPKSPKVSADLYLMIAVIENYDYFTIVRNELSTEDLIDKDSRELFLILEDCYRKNEISLNSVLERLANDQLKHIILERIASDEFKINQEQIIKDTIRRIKRRNIEKKKNQLDQHIKKLEKVGNSEQKIQELLSELMFLNKEIEKLRVNNNDGTAD